MRPVRFVIIVLGSLFTLSVFGGCGGPGKSTTDDAGQTTQSFSYDSKLYRVEIEQRDRDGACVQRTVLFTSYSQLYVDAHIDRARAVDYGCDAGFTSDFDDFEIMRDPDQQIRYQNDSSFRRKIEEDLWDSYQNALFRAESRR